MSDLRIQQRLVRDWILSGQRDENRPQVDPARIGEGLTRCRPISEDDDIGPKVEKYAMILSRMGFNKEEISKKAEESFGPFYNGFQLNTRVSQGIWFGELYGTFRDQLINETIDETYLGKTKRTQSSSLNRPWDGKHRNKWMKNADEFGILLCPLCGWTFVAETGTLSHIYPYAHLSDEERKDFYSTLFVCGDCDGWVERINKDAGLVIATPEGRLALSDPGMKLPDLHPVIGANVPYWSKSKKYWLRKYFKKDLDKSPTPVIPCLQSQGGDANEPTSAGRDKEFGESTGRETERVLGAAGATVTVNGGNKGISNAIRQQNGPIEPEDGISTFIDAR